LLALVSAAEPPERERQADWAALVETALDGLAELGDVAALPHVTPLLNSKHAALRQAAANALVWVALPHHFETLRGALHHADPHVKYRRRSDWPMPRTHRAPPWCSRMRPENT
jgi:ParB family chromosome partitioning protein